MSKQIGKHIDEAIRQNKIIMITNSGSCSEMSAIYFAMVFLLFIFTSGKNVFMLDDLRCSCDLLCRNKGKILCWILKCKFYGSQKAFWKSDEEIEGRDQQVIKEWGKSFDMRVIIRITEVWVDLQAIIPTLAVRNYVQLHVITLN